MSLAPVSLLLVSGSLRAGSTNAAVLRTAEALAPDDVETVVYSGMAELPGEPPTLWAQNATAAIASHTLMLPIRGAGLSSCEGE